MTDEGAPPKVGNDRGSDSKWGEAGEMTQCRLGNHAVTGGGEAFVTWICQNRTNKGSVIILSGY